MSDRKDSKVRELTYRLIAMAPEAPPFPQEPTVGLAPSPPAKRSSPALWVATAAAVALIVVGVPLLLLRGDPAPETTGPVVTQPTVAPSVTVPAATSTSLPEVTTTATSSTTCSASELDEPLVEQPGVPTVVAATRKAIYDAAVACDIPALVDLASSGERDFTASFGGDDPATFWVEREGAGVPLLADLVRHLNLAFAPPSGRADDLQIYVWPFAASMPSADGEGIPAEDYAALLELYPIEELRQQFEVIGGYVGWRTGITADGEWLFFVEGD